MTAADRSDPGVSLRRRRARAGRGARRSELLVRAVLAFCVVYGIFVVQTHGSETLPFFAWDLFSSVPAREGADYSLRIVEAEALKKPVPVYFENADLHPAAFEIQGYVALQALGKAIDAGEAIRAEVMRRSFEGTYLSDIGDVRYEIVRRTFDTRARVDCRECFIDEDVRATYTNR